MGSRVREKLTMNAMMSSDLEIFLRKNKQYEPFENGSASCYVCNKPVTIKQIGRIYFDKRGPEEPEIYRDRTLLQKILKKDPDKIDLTIRYCCESFICASEFTPEKKE